MNKQIATALTLAVAGSMVSGAAHAAFEIKQNEAPKPADMASVFDQSEYSVWVDNTYQAVREYGKRSFIEATPSYGDPMPLSDALKILVPSNWKVFRAKNLEQDGRLLVSWDIDSATWIGVLENLGERHGLQFHIDHNRQEVFVQDGRRLIFDRPIKYGLTEQYPRAGTERIGQHSQTTISTKSEDHSSSSVRFIPHSGSGTQAAFTIYEGDAAKGVMKDLALMFGYESTHWLLDNQVVHQTQTFNGDGMQIMAQVAKRFGGRVCLYETDMTAAVVPKSMECPVDDIQ